MSPYIQDAFEREYQLRTSTSLSSLGAVNRSRSLARVSTPTKVYTIKRSTSVPSVARRDDYLNSKYRAGSRAVRSRYTVNYDLQDEYWWDRRYYMNPLYNPRYRYGGRRYFLFDAPYSLWYNYPSLCYYPSRYFGLDEIDPLYWRRYRSPYYDRSLGAYGRQYDAWRYESSDIARGISLYKNKTINFNILESNWLSPSSWERRLWHWKNMNYPSYYY